jgi:hypothetical protein
LLCYKLRIWVENDQALHIKLIASCHASAIGGQSGVPVTYRRIKHLFTLKGMEADVQDYVQSCITCQQAKSDRSKHLGLLQPLVVPEGVWQVVTMDFVEGLPQSGAANCILVVVNKFTKYTHFLPIKHPYPVMFVTKVFLDHIYKFHGMPLS